MHVPTSVVFAVGALVVAEALLTGFVCLYNRGPVVEPHQHCTWPDEYAAEPDMGSTDAVPTAASSSLAGAEPQRDAYIGYTRGYDPDVVCRLVGTLLATGFKGDIIMLLADVPSHDWDILRAKYRRFPQVKLVDSKPFEDTATFSMAHLGRFYAMHQYLKSIAPPVRHSNPCHPGAHWCRVDDVPMTYRYVLTADTRDIIFQADPSRWLARHLGQSQLIYGRTLELVAPAEGYQAYTHDWTVENQGGCTPTWYQETGGKFSYYNAGTIAGTQRMLMSAIRSIYEAGKHIPMSVAPGACDQAVWNHLLLDDPMVRSRTLFSSVCSGWVFFYSFQDGMRGTMEYEAHAWLNYTTRKGFASCQGFSRPVVPVMVHLKNTTDLQRVTPDAYRQC
eukprot:m51a1_g7260 hypothetical protein (390) ;mRNA; r:178687-180157